MLYKNRCLPQSTRKQAGIKLPQIKTRKDNFHQNWRKKIVGTISRFSVLDGNLTL